MKSYGQYCPIARTSEFFAERWTPIIVRNLATGCRTFTELREGAPGIPKALLAERLELLERYGIVARGPKENGRGSVYELTASGRELKAVCDAMGEWGARWLEIEPHHLDPAYVLWATSRLVDLEKVPRRGVVVRFDLRGKPMRRFWMLLQRPRAELCTSYPGRTEDVIVTTDAETLVKWNLRRIPFQEALRSGRCRVEGPAGLVKAFPTWMRPSPFADISPAR
ncbi:MAG: winged helix-turn-helix transcriptional regulator [Actinomycetota bacterium]